MILSIIIFSVGAFVLFSSQKGLPSNGTGLSGYVIAEGMQPGLTTEEIQEMLNREVEASKISFS